MSKTAVPKDDLADRVELLRRSTSLGSMSEAVLGTIAQALHPALCAKGDVIIHQGQLVENLCIVVDGLFEVRLHTDSGAVVPIAVLHEGDCSGEMSLLTGEPASTDVIALEQSRILTLRREDFEALIAQHTNILRQFIRLLAHRLRKTNTAVGVARELGERLTHFIIEGGPEEDLGLLGRHAKISAARQQAAKLAGLDVPVFIHGEPGTGKEAVARLIHFHSARKNGPLLSVDCRQIAESPWGDKLFGAYQREDSRQERRHVVCYLDMAEGGTVFLNDIEHLPAALQERLIRFLDASTQTRRRDVRIIANSEHGLAAMVKTGQMQGELAKVFADHQILTPPLRELKRDIPDMAMAFVKAPAARLGKTVGAFSSRALTKLVSHDYRYGNARELKTAVERAVILSETETINAEEIFLGVPVKAGRLGLNLLAPALKRWSRPILNLPEFMRVGAAAAFLGILWLAFFGADRGAGNISTVLVWSIWWPSLILSFLVVGRMWCSVCPMAFAGETAQRFWSLKRRVPDWIENHTALIVAVGFFVILWTEAVTGMRHSPALTGVLLLAIIAGAVATSILYPRRTWCLHLCPLGSFAGLCGRSALLEIRPTFDVCAAKCSGHMCYKGDAATPGCPMHSHLMFVNSNQDCVMCFNCVRLCPNGSPQLNLRAPAEELLENALPEPGAAMTVAMLAGLLPALFSIQRAEQGPSGTLARLLLEQRFLFVSASMGLGAALPVLGLRAFSRSRYFRGNGEFSARFWKMLLAWVPLVAAGYAAYQIGYIPGFAPGGAALALRLEATGAPLAIFPLALVAGVVLVTIGALVAGAVLWRIRGADDASAARWRARLAASQFAGLAAYWALLCALIARVI